MQEGIQNLPQLQERQTELQNLLVTIAVEAQENQAKVGPLKTQLNTAIKEKSQNKESNRVKVNQMLMKLDTLKRMDQDIQRWVWVSDIFLSFIASEVIELSFLYIYIICLQIACRSFGLW